MEIESSDQIAPLEKAVNDSASRSQPIWISWLLLLTYVTISVASVTGADLLIGKVQKIQILNIELPLESFFISIPIFILLYHFYVLLQLDSLASKLQEYNTMIAQLVQEPADRRMLRRRLDDFMLVQILAGPSDRRQVFTRFCSKTMFFITVILAPIVGLLLIEFKFLGYHDSALTWWHRFSVLLDLALIGTFSYRIFGFSVSQTACWIVGAATCLMLAFFIAIFPTETLYDRLHNPLTAMLFERSPDEPSLSFFSNRLLAPDQVFELGKAPSFRGRDLEGSYLSRSDLQGSDFTDANLTRAVLREAKLTRANFGCIDPIHEKNCADLHNADLTRSQLQGANFFRANLAGAILANTDLSSADLSSANLNAADLRWARLNHAKMNYIFAHGAAFDDASFSGAELADADLQDARILFEDARILWELAFTQPILAEQALWSKELAQSEPNSLQRESLENDLDELACKSDVGAASGLIKNHYITRLYLGAYANKLAKKLRNWENDCPLARQLGQPELTILNEIIANNR